MDRFPQMLYRCPGPEPMHGGHYATRVVNDETEHAHAIAEGWFESTVDAKAADDAAKAAAQQPENAPATRAELEQKATELGIKFDGRWGDKKLADAIAAALPK